MPIHVQSMCSLRFDASAFMRCDFSIWLVLQGYWYNGNPGRVPVVSETGTGSRHCRYGKQVQLKCAQPLGILKLWSNRPASLSVLFLQRCGAECA
jgi:hypothetical protein